MQQFRVLEHTADIGFEAFGNSRREVFANAARALLHLIVDLDSIQARESVAVRVEGRDAPDLLVHWLSEILYLHDAEGWVFREFEMTGLEETSLAAVARGEKFDPVRHQAKLLIK